MTLIIGKTISPSITIADKLAGDVLGAVGHLPQLWQELEVSYFLLRRLIGVKSEDKKQTKVRSFCLFPSNTKLV